MKFALVLMLFSFYFNVSAKTLSCSANGTDVYYINGVLTNDAKNKTDTKAMGALFNSKLGQLDLGSNVSFTGIYNPSFGVVNDVAELFSQAYYAKTGKDDGKAIFNLIQNIPEAVGNIASVFDPTEVSKAIGMFGYTKTLNLATLVDQANEDWVTAASRSMASTDKLFAEDSVVINSVANAVIKSKKDNRKVLFVAHSQGNAALVAGIKKLQLYNDPGEVDYMKRFMGVYHVASPVSPLSSNDFKQRNIRSEQDKVISAAQFFSNLLPIPEYRITTAPVTHKVTFNGGSDITGHFFHDTYLSDKIVIEPVKVTNPKAVIMSNNFVDTLSDLATALADNCYDFDLISSTTDTSGYQIPGGGSISSKVSGNIADGFKDGGIFPKNGVINFSIKLSGAFTTEDIELSRTDTGEILNPFGFSVSYTTGGDKTIPLKLVVKNSGVNVVGPILKTLKIHLSERLKAKVTMCGCNIWGNEAMGYFSYDGSYVSWGVEQTGVGPISMTTYSLYSLPTERLFAGGYGYGPINYPDLKWFTTSTYTRILPDGPWIVESSQHVIIKDSGGVIFDGAVTSPCKAGESIPPDGILPVN